MARPEIARHARPTRWIAGVLFMALVATSSASVPAAADASSSSQNGGPPDELLDRLATLDEDQQVEAPPWEDSPAVPIAVPEVPDDVRVPDPTFPDAVTLEQSLSEAAADGLEATAERPVVLRPGRRGTSDVPAAAGGNAEPQAGRAEAAVRDIEVTVLDRAAAERARVAGFVFTVGAKGGPALGELAQREEHVPVELEIDYSGFASAYGGGFAERLQVVALPPCAVEDPVPDGCNVHGRRLESRNLWDDDKLVVEVPDLAGLATQSAVPLGPDSLLAEGSAGAFDLDATAGKLRERTAAAAADIAAELAQGSPEASQVPDQLASFASTAGGPIPVERSSEEESAPSVAVPDADVDAVTASEVDTVVLAVTSGVAGDAGTFGATPLSPSGQWNVATGTGEFSWSYPIDIPASPGGAAPSVGLAYSSGAVDGLTHSTNTQASQNGTGFGDFANGFIERSYEPCVNVEAWLSTDLCWKGHLATISLNGLAGPLIPVDAEAREWRVMNDPGWRIERVGDPGGAPVNGQDAPEYWKVTGPDGTQYHFGRNRNPDTGAQTNSFWYVPVTADHSGEPCFGNIHADAGICDMAWRWNLDRVVDPHGNVTTYTYSREGERYDAWNGLFQRSYFIRGGMLSQITYGAREGSSGPPAARITFGRQYRCIYLAEACGAATNGNSGGFPDVPVDLICGESGPCGTTTPAFFSTRRYSYVLTEVRDSTTSSGWRTVAQHNLLHAFKGEQGGTDCHLGQNHCKLYLTGIQHAGVARGLNAYPLTLITYDGGYLANRVDTQHGPAMNHYRVTGV